MADVPPRKLAPTETATANAAIARWQQAPAAPVRCPVCDAPTLVIVDRSARPYTAWFALSCNACGLDDIITYAMGGTGNSWS